MEQNTIDDKASKKIKIRPYWGTWKRRPNCHLCDAVALSLNINPDALNFVEQNNPKIYQAYISRLETASLATYDGGQIKEIPNHPESGDDPYERVVSLASFVDFAINQSSWQTRLTEQFLLLGNNQHLQQGDSPAEPDKDVVSTDNTSGQVTVTLPHMTKLLAALFQVMRDQWSDYKPDSEKSYKPKQTTVAEAIDKALGYNPQSTGNPSRNGQVLATLIRHDSLRDEDHRTKAKKS